MKTSFLYPLTIVALLFATAIFSGCNKKSGCMDATATNYDPDAEVDDGSCSFEATIQFSYALDAGCGDMLFYVDSTFKSRIDATTNISDLVPGTETIAVSAGTFTYNVNDDCLDWDGEFTIEPGDVVSITLAR